MEKYTIDAKGKKIGRVATDAAVHLMGKHRPDFAKNVIAGVSVEVVNAAQLDIHPKKGVQKTYTRYSGYPGGLKKESLNEVIEKKGCAEAVRRAVYGMLPGNTLRSRLMKRLIITE